MGVEQKVALEHHAHYMREIGRILEVTARSSAMAFDGDSHDYVNEPRLQSLHSSTILPLYFANGLQHLDC